MSKFCSDINRYIDEVGDDEEPLVVVRSDNISVVVISINTLNSYSETEYLMRSPTNARRLLKSTENAHKGNVEEHALIED